MSADIFTVIVPTHKRPQLLHRALQSLIAQSYQAFQVIVVDDAASHIAPYEDLQALQGRGTYIIRGGNSGPAESRNLALKLVSTPYIVFLDDDDAFEPDHLQTLSEIIGKTSPEIVFCDFKVRNEDRTTAQPTHISTDSITLAAVTRESLFISNKIPNSCLAFRSDVVATIRFDTEMRIYEDWDFLLQCLMHRPLTHLPCDSVVIHKSNATAPENLRRGNTRDDLIVEVMLQMYKKHLAPDDTTRIGRQALMASAGISVQLLDC
jgi:glycosyltransferase involved in cell wall biosynthesis